MKSASDLAATWTPVLVACLSGPDKDLQRTLKKIAKSSARFSYTKIGAFVDRFIAADAITVMPPAVPVQARRMCDLVYWLLVLWNRAKAGESAGHPFVAVPSRSEVELILDGVAIRMRSVRPLNKWLEQAVEPALVTRVAVELEDLLGRMQVDFIIWKRQRPPGARERTWETFPWEASFNELDLEPAMKMLGVTRERLREVLLRDRVRELLTAPKQRGGPYRATDQVLSQLGLPHGSTRDRHLRRLKTEAKAQARRIFGDLVDKVDLPPEPPGQKPRLDEGWYVIDHS